MRTPEEWRDIIRAGQERWNEKGPYPSRPGKGPAIVSAMLMHELIRQLEMTEAALRRVRAGQVPLVE